MQKPFSSPPSERRPRRAGLWKPSLCLACGALSAAASLFTGQSARAAADTWTGNTTVNWSMVDGFTTVPVSGFTPVFGVAGTAGTTLNDDLANAFSIGGMTFNAGASSFTINGNSLTLGGTITNSNASGSETLNDALILSGARIVTGVAGSSTTFGGAISGAFTLTDTSVGTTTFSNANSTFSGATNITIDGVTYTEGVIASTALSTIAVGASSTFTGSTLTSGPLGTGVVVMANNADLEAVNGAQTIGNTIVLNNSSATFGNATAGVSSTLTLAGPLIFGGTGTVTDNNSALNINGGIQIRNTTGIVRIATFAGTGNVNINSSVVNGLAGTTGSVAYTGSATLALNGNNSYTGTTTVASGGTIQLGNANGLGIGGLTNNQNATNTTVSTGATLDLNGQAGITEPISVAGAGVGSNGALINSNATAAASLNNGVAVVTLPALGSGTGISASTPPTVTFSSPAAGTTATGNISLGVTAASFTINGGTTVYSAKPTVTVTGGAGGAPATATAILSGGTTGTVTGITITNAGYNFGATAPVITFTGGTVTTAGMNPTGTGNAANYTVSAVVVTNPGSGYTSAPTLTFTAGGGATATPVLSSVLLTAATSVGGAGNATVNSTFNTGGFALTKVGAGSFTINGANASTTGTTTVSAGTLQFGTEASLYNATPASDTAANLTIASGATLTLNVGGAGQFTSSDVATISGLGTGSGGFQSGSFLGLDTTGGSFTYGNAITNTNGGANVLGLLKQGVNTLTLTAANSYTGGTTVNGGILQLSGAGTLGGTSGPLAVNAGGALDLGGTSQTVGSFTGTVGGAVYNDSGSGVSTLTVGSGNGTGGVFAGVIADNFAVTGGMVALTKVGTGVVALNGANTYTGPTTINNGQLTLRGLASLGGTAVTVNNNATLQINGSSTVTIGTSGAGSLTLNNGSTLSLVSSAINTLDINSSTAGANVLTLGSDTISLDIGGAPTADSDLISLGSGLTASVNGTTTINLNVIGTGLNGTQQQLIAWSGETGAGNFSLGTITGSTGGYTLSLTATATGLYLNEASTSTAYFKGSTSPSWATIGNFTTDQAGTTARTAPLDANTSVVFVANGASNYSPSTLDGSYTINSLTFNLGGVTIANGTGGPNTLTLASLAAGITVATGAGATPDVISANVALGGSQSFAVTDANSTLNISGVISDGGSGFSLTKTGAGTLALSGANTYGGTTTISGGTLLLNGSVASGAAGPLGNAASAIILGDASTAINNSNVSLLINGAYTVARPISVANQTTTGIYSIGGATDNSSTISGLISAAQGFNISQVANTGTNALSLTGGITGTATIGTVTANFANAGAVNVSTTGISDGASGGNIAVRQSGAGTTTFSVANSYSGGTTVAAGTLALSGAATLGNAGSALTVNGGTLDLGGTTQTVGKLSGSGGTVADNGGASTLTIGNGNASGGSFAGALTNGAGTLSVTKTGTGTLAFSGSNTYTGPTAVNAGALGIQSSGGLGTGVGTSTSGVTVASGAALQLSGNITTTTAAGLTLNGTGVAANPNGALENVSGNNTFSGPVTLGSASTIGSDAGTLTLNSATPISGTGTDLTFTGAGNGIISSVIGIGSNNLNKNGAGMLTLSGANTYTGATNVNAGTLAYSNVASLANSSGINLSTATILNYAGAGGTLATPINLSTTNGPFTLGNTGTGAINYTGAFSSVAGVKTLILGNATDAVGGSISTALADTSAGSLNVTKAGLSNSLWSIPTSTFTGTTTVFGGVLQVPAGTAGADGLANSPFLNLAGAGTNNYAIFQSSGVFNRTTGGAAVNGQSIVNIAPNSGFSAIGGKLTVTLNGGATLLYNSTVGGTPGFLGAGGSTFAFGSTTSDSQVEVTNPINLNTNDAFARIIYVEKGVGGDSALLSGVISNGAYTTSSDGLTKQGKGTLILSGANNYSGIVTVSSGSLVAGTDSMGTTSGAFGTGLGPSAAPTAQSSIIVGDGNTGSGGNAAVLIGGAFTVDRNISVTDSGTNNTYAIGGTTDATSNFTGTITDAAGAAAANKNLLSIVQAATTGTDTLNISGGIISPSGTKTLNFNNAGAVNVNTIGISSTAGTFSVTKTNTGTLNFATENDYTGSTTIGVPLAGTPASATSNGGTLVASASSALGSGGLLNSVTGAVVIAGIGTSAINVNNGATLRLATTTPGTNMPDVSDRVSNTATITLGSAGATGGIGGTIRRGSYVSEGDYQDAGMGLLSLVSNSTIDFGNQTAGTLGTLTFNAFAPNGFSLNIIDYVSHGTAAGSNIAGVDDRLVFASDQTVNLNDYLFNGVADASEINLGNGYFEIVPIPEPSTVAAILTLGAFGWFLQRRRAASHRVLA